MTMSIYEQALGSSFARLHPVLQRKFGLTSNSNQMVYGKGKMTAIRGGAFWYRPFLSVGIKEHLMFPERGQSIPFTLENYAYKDKNGRETVSWIRRFYFERKTRCFDAAMTYEQDKERIIDDFGLHRRLTSPLSLSVTTKGGLLIRSEKASLYKKDGSKIQLPFALSPKADVYEYYDEKHKAIQVYVHIYHPIAGTVMMYEGLVETSFHPTRAGFVPTYAKLKHPNERSG